MNLLIVDDHAGMRALIAQIVAQPGDRVDQCASGEAAVALARDFAPDVVTLDVRMPGDGGLEAARALREAFPAAHIVIVTAYDQPAIRVVARLAGADAFVPKDHLEQLPPLLAHFRRGPRRPTLASDHPAEPASEDRPG